MNKPYCYDFPRPLIAADCVIFGFAGKEIQLLLMKRDSDPFRSCWALPGGYVHEDETTEEAAQRVLSEKTGLGRVYTEQLFTFSDPARDPRERVISIAFYSLVNSSKMQILPGGNAEAADWVPVRQLPPLAFDHLQIAKLALTRLRGKIRYQPIGFELLPPKFTLSELQDLYEAILGNRLDKRNFRKKILSMGLLQKLDLRQQNVPHRAATLYRFDKSTYRKFTRSGFHFEL